MTFIIIRTSKRKVDIDRAVYVAQDPETSHHISTIELLTVEELTFLASHQPIVVTWIGDIPRIEIVDEYKE